jgi:hypothetical protein
MRFLLNQATEHLRKMLASTKIGSTVKNNPLRFLDLILD